MERPEIIEILIQSLHSSPPAEQRVAYAFLGDALTRPGEPVALRARLILHIGLYGTRQLWLMARDLSRRTSSLVPALARKLAAAAPAAGGLVLASSRASRSLLLFALVILANVYFSLRDVLLSGLGGAALGIHRLGVGAIDALAGALSVVVSVSLRVRSILSAFRTGAIRIATSVRESSFRAVRSKLSRLAAAYHAVGRGLTATYTRGANTVTSCATRTEDALRRAIDSVVDRYLRTRKALIGFITLIIDRIDRAYRTIVAIYEEIQRQATRQVLPEGATPFVAAALVCLVLSVFGVNSYFIINDLDRKAVFIDLSRSEWGDEALASILIGEGYDIYLQEKITEKRIKDLLATGRYYERVIRVTGYYSPLPDQKEYATGSYRGDIILNGRGVMGSDTTPVYMGMAAGPPHMEYGTNVIIEDLGKFDLPKIYTVHDRGGAINGNHLDIWVGKGEEAMKKAYEITGYYKVIVVGDK